MAAQPSDMDTTPDAASEAETKLKSRDEVAEGVKVYFEQLTKGCGKVTCDNPYCATNPSAEKRTPNVAAALALKFASDDKTYRCLPPSALSHTVLADAIDKARESSDWGAVKTLLYEVFSSRDALNTSFLNRKRPAESDLNLNLDLADVRASMALLEQTQEVHQTLFHAVSQLCDQLTVRESTLDACQARFAAILLQLPIMLDSDAYQTILPKVCRFVAHSGAKVAKALTVWWTSLGRETLQWVVRMIHQFMTIRIIMNAAENEDFVINFDAPVIHATKVLTILHTANSKLIDPLPAAEFNNDAVNEYLNKIEDFTVWKGLQEFNEEVISFCNHAFILSVATKASILNLENSWRHAQESRQALMEALLFMRRGAGSFKLEVHRSSVVREAIEQLSTIQLAQPEMLKRPLKVKFIGEDGIDEGGVRKEFFQLVLRDLFDPNYGMFKYDAEERLYWFNLASLETPEEFKLLGLVLGLALYNNVILDLHFPNLVYKKLLDEPVGLADLEELNPTLFRSFNSLLEYDQPDIQDVFPYNFVVEYEGLFGEKQQFELCEGGADVPLTLENRQEFVDKYVQWLLHSSIAPQFGAFKDGFFSVCEGAQALTLFNANELQLLLCGTEDLDFEALERVTVYDGGYGPQTPVIQWFWDIVKNSFSEEDRKALLFFSTGSDRVPVGGLSHLKFVIGKQGPDSDRLPSAHTCFNVLLLPDYSDKAKLERLLRNAIKHAEGFGML